MKKKIDLFEIINDFILCIIGFICIYPFLYEIFVAVSDGIYSFSTSIKPSSNGVLRPKILTITFNFRFSVFTSSTVSYTHLSDSTL